MQVSRSGETLVQARGLYRKFTVVAHIQHFMCQKSARIRLIYNDSCFARHEISCIIAAHFQTATLLARVVNLGWLEVKRLYPHKA